MACEWEIIQSRGRTGVERVTAHRVCLPLLRSFCASASLGDLCALYAAIDTTSPEHIWTAIVPHEALLRLLVAPLVRRYAVRVASEGAENGSSWTYSQCLAPTTK